MVCFFVRILILTPRVLVVFISEYFVIKCKFCVKENFRKIVQFEIYRYMKNRYYVICIINKFYFIYKSNSLYTNPSIYVVLVLRGVTLTQSRKMYFF